MERVCRRTLDEAEREFDGTVLNLKATHERLLRPKMNCADLMPRYAKQSSRSASVNRPPPSRRAHRRTFTFGEMPEELLDIARCRETAEQSNRDKGKRGLSVQVAAALAA